MSFIEALTKRFEWANRNYFESFALIIYILSLRYTQKYYDYLLSNNTEEQWLSQKYVKFTKYSKMTIARRGAQVKGDKDGQQNYYKFNSKHHNMFWKWQQWQISFRVDAHRAIRYKSNEVHIRHLNEEKLRELLINIFIYTIHTFSTCQYSCNTKHTTRIRRILPFQGACTQH